MDTSATGSTEPSSSKPKAATASSPASSAVPASSKVVIVDIGERQTPEAVKGLRSGKGKLLDHVERIVADLVAAGTIAGTAQPLVFVVREIAPPDDDDEDDD